MIRRTPLKRKKLVKKKKKSTLIPLPKLLEKTQRIVNQYIRLRDKDKGCICCEGPVQHAGHFYSAGHYTALRFDERNIHGQSAKCNLFLHGNLIEYRRGLVKRYGSQFVEDLENSTDVRKTHKWSRQELEDIIKEYTDKINNL